jgi:DNA-binding ferritin-like protein (Dps family)
MKKLVQVQEVEGQGMEALLGQNVTFFCLNYIYHGELVGVNSTDIILRNAFLVYETGDFKDKGFKDAQKLGDEWRIRTSIIESYGVFTNK